MVKNLHQSHPYALLIIELPCNFNHQTAVFEFSQDKQLPTSFELVAFNLKGIKRVVIFEDVKNLFSGDLNQYFYIFLASTHTKHKLGLFSFVHS